MSLTFSDVCSTMTPIPTRPECPLLLEAMRKLHALEMTAEQAIAWMESQPGYERDCRPDTCQTCKAAE